MHIITHMTMDNARQFCKIIVYSVFFRVKLNADNYFIDCPFNDIIYTKCSAILNCLVQMNRNTLSLARSLKH